MTMNDLKEGLCFTTFNDVEKFKCEYEKKQLYTRNSLTIENYKTNC